MRATLPTPLALGLALAACLGGCAKDEGAAAAGPSACGEALDGCADNERCLGGHCVLKEVGGEGVGGGEGEGEAAGDVPCVPPCTGTQRCGPGGQCLEAEICGETADCRPGRVCAGDRRCADVCRPSDCPRPGLCRRARCVAPESCASPEECGHGTACQFEMCYPPCDADADCPARQSCGADGVCEEPAACHSHRDCAPTRDCVDGVCVAAVAGGCDDEDPLAHLACGEGAACGPTGVCGPVRGCAADDDCDRGVCDGFGVCAACRVDDDCPGDQVCAPLQHGIGECAEPPACIADVDCLRGRVCGPAGACQDPDDCEDDGFAGNDTAATAEWIEDTRLTSLVRCPGADDWFRVTVPSGFAAEVYLSDLDGAGLILEQYLPASVVDPLDVADAPGPGQRIPIPDGAGDQERLVRVTAPPGGRGRYDLDVRLRPLGVCLDDPADDWGGDDTLETATRLRGTAGAVHARRLCDDGDWYQVTVESLSRIEAVAASTTPAATLHLHLFDQAGEEFFATDRPNPNELSGGGLVPGRYWMLVTAFSSQGADYGLGWQLTPDEAHLSERCRAAPTLEHGELWEGRLRAEEADEFRGSCAANDFASPEAVARIDMAGGEDLSVRIESADFEPVLYLRRGCGGGLADDACSYDPPEIYGEELGPGAWFVFVDAMGPVGQGRFEARVVTGNVTPPGENETCARPARISPAADGTFSVRGDTTDSQGDLQSPDCAPFGDTGAAGDLVYVIRTVEDRWFTAEVIPQGWDAVLQLYTDACDAAGLIACGDEPARINIPRLPAGHHFVVVDGYRGGDAGLFELTGTLAAPPPAPANDHCEAADPVEVAPDTGRASVVGDTVSATDQGEVGCGQAASRLAPDLFYALTLEERSDVRIRVVPRNGFVPAVALRSGTCRDGVEVVCTTAAPYSLTADGLLEGDYLIVVDGAQPGASGGFEIVVEVEPSP